MDVFITLFLIVFAGIFLFALYTIARSIGNSIAEKRYDESQPVLTKDVKISGKRSEVSGGGGGDSSIRTSYYATFEFIEDKKRFELEIEDEDYGLTAEDDLGKLTFQGRRFFSFERKTV